MDGAVQDPVRVQLDAPILLERRRPRVDVDRDRKGICLRVAVPTLTDAVV